MAHGSSWAGVRLELELWPIHQIPAASATYAAACSSIRSLTHWVRSPDPSCICHLCCSLQQHQILNPLSEVRGRMHMLTNTMFLTNWDITGTPEMAIFNATFLSCRYPFSPGIYTPHLKGIFSHLKTSFQRAHELFWGAVQRQKSL